MSAALSSIVIGLGHHGRSITRLAIEAGWNVIAAADPATAGQALRDVLELPEAHGTIVATAHDIPEPTLREADVVVLAAKLSVDAAVTEIERILALGTNVVTIIEQMFDPAALSDSHRARIEAAAQQGQATYFATGCQDLMWLGMAGVAVAGTRNLRSVTITQRFGVDGYPVPFVQGELGAGCAAAEFAEVAAEAQQHPAVLGSTLPLLADALRLTVQSQVRSIAPVYAESPLQSASFGREIPVTEAIGSRDETVIESVEGITLRAVLETTVVPPGGENDRFELVVDAEPVIRLSHLMDPGPACVDATLVNRLGDVVAATPGIATTFSLPFPTYHVSGPVPSVN